jgi:hypothetical protein
MKFIKKIRNIFVPQSATKLSDIPLEVGVPLLCYNDDETPYGVCGVVMTHQKLIGYESSKMIECQKAIGHIPQGSL